MDEFRLRVFMMVAREGNFTRAAQQLGISQPAVTHHMAMLEQEVGKTLIVRNRPSASLTPEGVVFREYAQRILHDFDALQALFGPSGKISSGAQVRIAATAYTASCILPPLLRDLLALTATPFVVETHPESDLPDAATDADLLLYTAARSETLDFDVASVVGVVPAVLATGGAALPEEPRFAVWRPYYGQIGADMYAHTVVVSDNLPMLTALVGQNERLVGILPLHATGGLTLHAEPLPHLQRDLHLRASGSFAHHGIAQWMVSHLQELLPALPNQSLF